MLVLITREEVTKGGKHYTNFYLEHEGGRVQIQTVYRKDKPDIAGFTRLKDWSYENVSYRDLDKEEKYQ